MLKNLPYRGLSQSQDKYWFEKRDLTITYKIYKQLYKLIETWYLF